MTTTTQTAETFEDAELRGYVERLRQRTGLRWYVVDRRTSKRGYQRATIFNEYTEEVRQLWWREDEMRWCWDGARKPAMDAQLAEHLAKYYSRHGKARSVEQGANLLGEPSFATITFADGYVATFQRSEHREPRGLNPWFRNERRTTESRFAPSLSDLEVKPQS